jgi:cbb3-type cytochrome oxidase subunit 3
MTATTRTHQPGVFAALALVSLLALAGCSMGSDSKSSSATAPAGTVAGGSSGGLTDGSSTPRTDESGTSKPDDRKVIIVMTVGVEVPDVAKAVDEVVALSARYGGSLSGSSVDLYDPNHAGGDLVFRLPPDKADAFIAALDPGIGRRTSLQTDTRDVTLQLTDLDARIATARAGLDRVRALLASAKNMGEVIALENELTTRETNLETLLAQKADLDGQVAMATITVHLSTSPDTSAGSSTTTGIGTAFHKGWQGFLNAGHALVVFVGYTAPFLVLGGVALAVAWFVRRRQRRAQRNRSAAPPLPPAPDADQRTSSPGS